MHNLVPSFKDLKNTIKLAPKRILYSCFMGRKSCENVQLESMCMYLHLFSECKSLYKDVSMHEQGDFSQATVTICSEWSWTWVRRQVVRCQYYSLKEGHNQKLCGLKGARQADSWGLHANSACNTAPQTLDVLTFKQVLHRFVRTTWGYICKLR